MTRNGFTLVETLVSIVAGGLLLGAISFVIAGLGDDLRKSESLNENRSHAARSILENALHGARFADQNFEPLPHSEDSLWFRMAAPAALQQQGYVNAVLQISVKDAAKTLVLQSETNAFPPIEILAGQQDISLEIKEVPEAQGEFVRAIAISYRGQGNADASEIIIHPKINGRGACVFDVISQRCRS